MSDSLAWEDCEDCDDWGPPDFMLVPPPPPPFQELCHYQGDCSHHPVINSLQSNSSIIHAVSLVTITSITIISVLVVCCVIVVRLGCIRILVDLYSFLSSETEKENQWTNNKVMICISRSIAQH